MVKEIEGFEDYLIYSDGRVFSKKSNKFLKQSTDKRGYKVVSLCKNGVLKQFKVHRLVAEAYIDNQNDFPQVNHKDENKANNDFNNLEWCTAKYNTNYGTVKEKISAKNSKPIVSVNIKTGKVTYYNSTVEASKYGYTKSEIWRACNGIYSQYKGCYWRYA